MELEKLEKTIDFAIEKEKEAVNFYKTCSELTSKAGMKKAFLEMSDEEKKHVEMLENFEPETVEKIKLKEVPDMKISDYLVDMEFSPDMSYQDLLILAMKREESSVKMYSNFADNTTEPSINKLFTLLAQEETRHKNRLQKEYDEVILTDN